MRILIIGLFFGILLAASPRSDAQELKLPYKDVGACPFECCVYRNWTAMKSITIHKSMSDNSPVIYRIRKGEKVRGLTGVVITSEPGEAKALKDITFEGYGVEVKKGEKVLLLTYQGEGYYRVWFKGKFFGADAYEDGLELTKQPRYEWWVKIRNRKGQIGWTKQSSDFRNQDECG